MVNLAVRAGWVVCAVLIMVSHGGIVALLGARALMTAVGVLSSVILIDRRLQRIQWTFEPRVMWQMVKASLPFALFRISRSLYKDTDTVMLSMMRGDLMTGWYAAAYKLRRALDFLPTGVFDAALPAMSRSSRDPRGRPDPARRPETAPC